MPLVGIEVPAPYDSRPPPPGRYRVTRDGGFGIFEERNDAKATHKGLIREEDEIDVLEAKRSSVGHIMCRIDRPVPGWIYFVPRRDAEFLGPLVEEELVVTLHVGERGPDSFAEIACTNIGGDELAVVRAELAMPVSALRADIRAALADDRSVLRLLLPDGRELGDAQVALESALEL